MTEARIEVLQVKGPLAESDIAAIAQLYGRHDSRYADAEFVKEVFVRNPLRTSYHAFAKDILTDQYIGHFGVIPVKACSKGKSIVAGKGEAYFIAESYRKKICSFKKAQFPLSLALPHAAIQLALEDLSIVQVKVKKKIREVLKLIGCKSREQIISCFSIDCSFTTLMRLGWQLKKNPTSFFKSEEIDFLTKDQSNGVVSSLLKYELKIQDLEIEWSEENLRWIMNLGDFIFLRDRSSELLLWISIREQKAEIIFCGGCEAAYSRLDTLLMQAIRLLIKRNVKKLRVYPDRMLNPASISVLRKLSVLRVDEKKDWFGYFTKPDIRIFEDNSYLSPFFYAIF